LFCRQNYLLFSKEKPAAASSDGGGGCFGESADLDFFSGGGAAGQEAAAAVAAASTGTGGRTVGKGCLYIFVQFVFAYIPFFRYKNIRKNQEIFSVCVCRKNNRQEYESSIFDLLSSILTHDWHYGTGFPIKYARLFYLPYHH